MVEMQRRHEDALLDASWRDRIELRGVMWRRSNRDVEDLIERYLVPLIEQGRWGLAERIAVVTWHRSIYSVGRLNFQVKDTVELSVINLIRDQTLHGGACLQRLMTEVEEYVELPAGSLVRLPESAAIRVPHRL